MRAAVLGSPIAHSLSPVLHMAAYAALGLEDWRYTAHECTEADLATFVDGLGEDWAGLSLTMPLKRVALDVATDVSALATATGAANTLVLNGGRRYADNTDVVGLVNALREAGFGGGGHAVVLGAGGTAQATLAALRDFGVRRIDVLVRSIQRIEELRDAAGRLGMVPAFSDALSNPQRVTDALGAADVVVSTLPGEAADGYRGVRPGTVVMDVVYAPWPTRFAATAASDGARVVSGLEMLLHQAVAQVELMTGKPGPVEPMRAALYAAAQARS